MMWQRGNASVSPFLYFFTADLVEEVKLQCENGVRMMCFPDLGMLLVCVVWNQCKSLLCCVPLVFICNI